MSPRPLIHSGCLPEPMKKENCGKVRKTGIRMEVVTQKPWHLFFVDTLCQFNGALSSSLLLLLSLSFKAMHNEIPLYLSCLVISHLSYHHSHVLRSSSSSNILQDYRSNRIISFHSFHAAAPNYLELPSWVIHSIDTFKTFWCHLKTFSKQLLMLPSSKLQHL